MFQGIIVPELEYVLKKIPSKLDSISEENNLHSQSEGAHTPGTGFTHEHF